REQGRAARRRTDGSAAHGGGDRQLGAAGDSHAARLRQPDVAARPGGDLRTRALQAREDCQQRRPQGRCRRVPREAAGAFPGTLTRGRRLLGGGGKMGGAMLEGWLARGLSPSDVIVAEPVEALRPKKPGIRSVASSQDVRETPDTVVLAVKPQTMDGVL